MYIEDIHWLFQSQFSGCSLSKSSQVMVVVIAAPATMALARDGAFRDGIDLCFFLDE